MNIKHRDTIVVVGFLILVQASGAIAGFWLPAIAPEVAHTLKMSPSLIAYVVLIQYIFAMFSSLLAGGFVARFGAWRSSQIALVIFAFSHTIFWQGSLLALIAGSITLGCAYGLVTPPAAHLLSKVVTPQNRNFIFSIRFTGVPIGGITAGLTAPAIALALGWRESMLVTPLLTLLLALAMQPFRQHWDKDRTHSATLFRNPAADIQTVWNKTSLKWITLSALCMGAVQTTLTTYTVTMLVEDLKYNLIAAGIGLSTIQFASVFGRLSWGWLADQLGSGALISMIIAVIVAVCACVTTFLSPDWPELLVYGLCFVFGFVGMGWNGVYASEIARLAPPHAISGATGASMFIMFSGVFLGPLIFVFLFSFTNSYTSTYFVTAFVAVGALVCLLRSVKAQ